MTVINYLLFRQVSALRTLILILSLVLLSASKANVQTPSEKLWDKAFGGDGYDGFRSLQQTMDGGYILGGHSNSGVSGDKSEASQGGYDYWIVKIDVDGNKLWDRAFGGGGYDGLRSLQQTTDGGYILGGYSNSGISGDKSEASQGANDYWVVKIDVDGNKLWDKTYGGSGSEFLYTLQQTIDGGYILGGYSDSGVSGDKSEASRGGYDYWVVKVDANGNKQWDKSYGGSGRDNLNFVQQTEDGGYILAGESNSGISGEKTEASRGNYDYWVVKIDANGNKQWDKSYGGSATDYLCILQKTIDGGYILGGYSNSAISGEKSENTRGGHDYWVIKIDKNGNKQWDKTIGGSGLDQLNSVHQTKDGGYILGGHSKSGISGEKTEASRGESDYWIVKIRADGSKMWDKSYGGSGSDFLYSAQQTPDGDYILGGFSESDISGDKTVATQGSSDFWVVKVNSSIGDCPLRDVRLTSQAEIEQFAIDYPNCTEIRGYLLIGNTFTTTDITDLTSLNKIKSVAGGVSIQNNPLLVHLGGLESVTTVEGWLAVGSNNSLTDIDALKNVENVYGINIRNNPTLTSIDGLSKISSTQRNGIFINNNASLTNIDGLSNITSVGGIFEIAINPSLTNLDGLRNIAIVEGHFGIVGHPLITNLDGLSKLTSIRGFSRIVDNASLIDVDGLSNLTSVGEFFLIGDNESLVNVDGLISLTSIGRNLEIESNSSLVNLDGLGNLTSVGQDINITNNVVLSDITGLRNTAFNPNLILAKGLTIVDNPALAVCDLPNFCTYLANDSATHPRNISGNAGDCISEEAVKEVCLVSIDEFDSSSFATYPNPVIDLLNITYSKMINSVEVVDIIGRTVIRETTRSNDIRINMSSLKAGIYLVKVNIGYQVKVVKVVKS